jgi:hypothetical protein
VATAVFISNDDDQYRNFHHLQLQVAFGDSKDYKLAEVPDLPYSQTIRVPVKFFTPGAAQSRLKTMAKLRLLAGTNVISETTDPIEVFPTRLSTTTLPAKAISLSPHLSDFVGNSFSDTNSAQPKIILAGSLEALKSIRPQIENGVTAILFSPGNDIVKMFPEAFLESKKVTGEFVDFFPAEGTALTRNLQRSDLKWWARRDDWRNFVASQAQRLRVNGPARELIRYIPPHGYITPEKLPDQYWTVLSEIRLGKGRLWICDLDLEECVGVDPVADLFAQNLFAAALDPDSTRSLPRIPTHEEFMQGRAVAQKSK